MTIQFEKLKARLLSNPRVKAEYDALAPEFEIAAELLRARLRAGLSQAELAARMAPAAPRQLAANSMCGCRRPDARFKTLGALGVAGCSRTSCDVLTSRRGRSPSQVCAPRSGSGHGNTLGFSPTG